jgi:hypothetical protein
MLTPADIAAIRERAEKATPGPLSVKAWRYHAPTYGAITDAAGDGIALVWSGDRASADAAFLAAARTDIPDLMAHIDALTARVAELEAGQAWRPIETAPKDGAQFIAISKYGDVTYPVKWDVDRQMWVEYGLDGFDTMDWIRADRPDLWAPIPDPPTR